MDVRSPAQGNSSPTAQTGINLNAPITGWAAWFLQPDSTGPARATEITELSESAALVLENCRDRGLAPELLEIPEPADSDIEGQLRDGKALIVVARKLPPSTVASRIVLVGTATAPTAKTAPWAAVVDRAAGSPQDCALRVLAALEQSHLIPADSEETYTPEEEERLRKALDDLGYL